MRVPKTVLKTVRWTFEILDGAFLVCMVAEGVPPLLNRLNGKAFIGVIEPIRTRVDLIARPLVAVIRSLPHSAGGADLTPYIAAAAFFGLAFLCARAARALRVEILAAEQLEEVAVAEEAARKSGVAGKLAQLEASRETGREQVLEVYAKAKALIEEHKREVSFLAADVVGSTVMKQGEDPVLAERDFGRYRKLVEGVFARRGVLKSSWTPDGVMACFADLDGAVGAGQDLIRGLKDFNRTEKAVKADFAVRCGVNSGAVLYDEETPMEKMSDGAIDLAGHMQKHAEPDSIYVARDLLGERARERGFRDADGKVDGRDVSVWSPSSSRP